MSDARLRGQPRVQLRLPGNRPAVPASVRAMLVCEYETGETVVIDWDVDPHAIPDELLPPTERGLHVDAERERVVVNGRVVDINSGVQYGVIYCLWRADGHIVSRDRLLAEAWPDDAQYEASDDVVSSMIKRLRQKIAEIDPSREYIVTERGRGFRLECHND